MWIQVVKLPVDNARKVNQARIIVVRVWCDIGSGSACYAAPAGGVDDGVEVEGFDIERVSLRKARWWWLRVRWFGSEGIIVCASDWSYENTRLYKVRQQTHHKVEILSESDSIIFMHGHAGSTYFQLYGLDRRKVASLQRSTVLVKQVLDPNSGSPLFNNVHRLIWRDGKRFFEKGKKEGKPRWTLEKFRTKSAHKDASKGDEEYAFSRVEGVSTYLELMDVNISPMVVPQHTARREHFTTIPLLLSHAPTFSFYSIDFYFTLKLFSRNSEISIMASSSQPTSSETLRFELSDLGTVPIETTALDAADFFPNLKWENSFLPIDDELLKVAEAEDMVSDWNAQLTKLFDIARRNAEPPAFSNYNSTHRELGIWIDCEFKYAHVGVSLSDQFTRSTALVIQEDKSFWDPNRTFEEAESKMILAAIAALSDRVEHWLNSGNQAPCSCPLFCSGIVMSGQAPVFYQVVIDTNLIYYLDGG
ncbi:hypothetical protein CPB83DRAFT_883391 [Crepidotus variabilis]|uniref:Uncharacterized protein n=1 Tax=Crepidotus variabilis TaxID=179855 RepID=A0A9P6JPM6_9AGAR|nr:hypothetical protein CPB83DRAFT_883391 [Crepidotus variabilis]